jgi:hypothetical protein
LRLPAAVTQSIAGEPPGTGAFLLRWAALRLLGPTSNFTFSAKTDVTFKEFLHELRFTRAVFQQHDVDQRRHDAFFMLPGGGSLMMAQKTPSSLTELINS